MQQNQRYCFFYYASMLKPIACITHSATPDPVVLSKKCDLAIIQRITSPRFACYAWGHNFFKDAKISLDKSPNLDPNLCKMRNICGACMIS